MALLNYIGSGTYAMVNNITWDKLTKHLVFELLVYKDATKQVHLCSKNFDLWCYNTFREVKSLSENAPPEGYANGEICVIGPAPTGEFAGHENQFAVRVDDTWGFFILGPYGEILFHAATQGYYQMNANAELVLLPSVVDSRTWDAFFDTEAAITNEESNIIAQIYLWLKTQPGFESVADG